MRPLTKRTSFAILCLLLLVSCICGCGSKATVKDPLVVLNYGKYIDPELLKEFEKETGITVAYEEYENPEEMYTKYKAGSISYDLLCSSEYMIQRLIESKETLPIDWDKIPNVKNMDPLYFNYAKAYDPKNAYSLPYFYGTVGILYDPDKVDPKDMTSWDVLWNPKYANSIIMANSVRDTFIPALIRNGYSINSTSELELRKSLALLKDQKEIVYAYLVDEVANEMAAGNATMALCYSGEAAFAQDMNDQLEFFVPPEGSCLWIDSWVIPKTCTQKDDAQRFLDFLCEKEIAMRNFDYVYYATPNKAAYEALDPEVQEDEVIFPPKETMDHCEIFTYLDPEITRLYSDMWKELKSY